MRNLRAANLNLLPVLRVLLRYRNVTNAARAMNVSQSSVSEALGKLRHMLKDELLVSIGGQMTLTALARRLQPVVESSLESVEALIGSSPAGTDRSQTIIDIAVNDYAILVLGDTLINEARRLRPDVSVRFHDISNRTEAALRSGNIDFIITSEVGIGATDAQLDRLFLFEDPVVCLIDAESPIGDVVSEEQYWRAPHVFFSPRGETFGASRTTILQQIGDLRADATLVQSYLLLPFFVEGTETIALAHQRLAKRLLPAAAVRIAAAPFSVTARIAVLWDATRQDRDKKWFLDLLVSQTTKSNAI